MRKVRLAVSVLLLAYVAPALAVDANVRVIISGEVRPGVYGQVEFGNAPPPPLVYAQPVRIVNLPQPMPVTPLYLHVPPGHAKHWEKHCREYNACGSPVYFVKSAEYEEKMDHKEKKEKKEKKDKKDK